MAEADIRFYFDPVCPFAWMTSKWVRMVAAQRDYDVDWRFISLRMINSHIDYDSHFPTGRRARRCRRPIATASGRSPA
jgi:2-hydroxychromene-2-carboxylate isomerase